MNTRIFSVIAVATLMTLSSGCSGTRNFLFGRGARCGLCSKLSKSAPAPQFGNTMQAPCGPTCQTPPNHGGCNSYAGNAYNGQVYDGQVYSSGSQPSGCGCNGNYGNVVEGYGPMTSDPYMQGEVVGGSATYQDQVIGSQGNPGTMTPIQPDDFSARRFDSDGNRIMWEEPLPEGNTVQ